jgi:acyl-CoA reductase-like NAD-dependent aldehyde dehydrogenase
VARKLLINGHLVEGAHQLDVVNPATGEVFEQCGRADLRQMNAAVAAAKGAFPAWARLSFSDRRARLEAIADAIAARREELEHLLTLEQGKPLAQAAGEVDLAMAGIRAYAAMTVPSRLLRQSEDARITEERAPLGVVAAIVPWNFPVAMIMVKIAPALIVGNCVVAKPAPTTPLTALLIGEIAAPLLPPGVLNIIVDENDLGPALTSHPDIAKISFTGSTETGKKVMGSAADTLKRVTLELGGNDCAIVLADADIAVAAPILFGSAMANSGQICMAPKRIYVHSSIIEPFCRALTGMAQATIVDDGLNPEAGMGPVQNRQQYEKLKEFLAEARAKGRVVAGGTALDRPGYFIPPTIVRDLPDDARLVREEQFGPVLPILSFDQTDEVAERANATRFGLAASVWTSDLVAGAALASRLEAGTVWVNKCMDVPFDVPFRGAKQSGIGVESGQEGLEEYTQARIVNIALAPSQSSSAEPG